MILSKKLSQILLNMISEQVGYPKISHYPYREKLMMVQRSFAHHIMVERLNLNPIMPPNFQYMMLLEEF